MNKLIYFIILNILLIGSVYAEKNKFLNMAQSKVKQEMKDPDSTKFQNLREIKNSVGESVVCGEVNAKNSYGGYVGYHLFSYSPDGVVILNSPKDSDYSLYTTNFTEPLSYQDSAFLKLPKFP